MERTTYRDIRIWAIESAYITCRSIFSPSRVATFPIEKIDIFGSFFSETHGCSETDVEELMWRTLELIFDRGIGPKLAYESCSRIITEILSRHDFDSLVAELPTEEAEEIKTDLQLLGFL